MRQRQGTCPAPRRKFAGNRRNCRGRPFFGGPGAPSSLYDRAEKSVQAGPVRFTRVLREKLQKFFSVASSLRVFVAAVLGRSMGVGWLSALLVSPALCELNRTTTDQDNGRTSRVRGTGVLWPVNLTCNGSFVSLALAAGDISDSPCSLPPRKRFSHP